MQAQFGRWLTTTVLLLALSSPAIAQPKIGLKLDLLSIRNRQSAPVPCRVRLEYNQPQIVEGTLELEVYDSQEYIVETSLLARIRREGIVLAGADLQFNLLLPPLRPSTNQNYAVRAWFVTEDERIPLSSIRDRLNPPEPFDLLMLPESQRGRVIGSVCRNAEAEQPASEDRRLLQDLLSFGTWGLSSGFDSDEVPAATETSLKGLANPLQSLVHFVYSWKAADLPEDPLWLCAFDMLLISDGGLSSLTKEQLNGVLGWVRAGGSVCIHAPEQLTSDHLTFLRELMGFGKGQPGELTLDSEGRLLAVIDNPDVPLFSSPELGRAVLLPSSAAMTQLLAGPQLQGNLLKFLWRFREDVQLSEPESFRREGLLKRLNTIAGTGVFEFDEVGLYVTDLDQLRSRTGQYYAFGGVGISPTADLNGRYYLDEANLTSTLAVNGLQPMNDGITASISRLLLPASLRLVPTSVMSLILISYVIVVGPLEYVILGWLRARKYTWFVFPATTLAFTLLTMAVAQAYMGGQDSMRTLTVTDLGEDSQPLRQSTLTTLFHGSQATLSSDHRREFAVHMSDEVQADLYDPYGNYSSSQTRSADIPPEYQGNFPQNWTLNQPVRQWSPVSLRTFSIAPDSENLKIPDLPWDDAHFVTTDNGRAELAARLATLQSSSGDMYYAAVFNSGVVTPLYGMSYVAPPQANLEYGIYNSWEYSGDQLLHLVLQTLPTQGPRHSSRQLFGFFSLFSGISPDGSGTLEDLTMSDGSDPKEWVLMVARRGKSDFYQDINVFRRKYRQ
jgi:hypothetical protein